MITIKEYAESRGKSQQAVYKQLRSAKNKDRLEGHVEMISGKKWLDDTAVDILDESKQSPVTIFQETQSEEMQRLKEENDKLKNLVIHLQSELLDNKQLLLESREDITKLRRAAAKGKHLQEQVQDLQKKLTDQGEEVHDLQKKLADQSEELQREQEKTWLDKLFRKK